MRGKDNARNNTGEVSKLYNCIRELADYHNTTSENFKGYYPLNPYEKTLESFEAALQKKECYIAVTEIESMMTNNWGYMK